MKAVLLLISIGVFFGAVYSQSTGPAVGIQDVYLAKDNGKGKPGAAATIFAPTDIPIYCVVQLDATASVTVKMDLIAENVPGVKAETRVVSTSYTTKNGESRVDFNGRPSGKWVAGRYRADIYLDGRLSKDVSFEIKQPVNASGGVKAFQAQKPPSRASRPRKKNPYVQTDARIFNH